MGDRFWIKEADIKGAGGQYMAQRLFQRHMMTDQPQRQFSLSSVDLFYKYKLLSEFIGRPIYDSL